MPGFPKKPRIRERLSESRCSRSSPLTTRGKKNEKVGGPHRSRARSRRTEQGQEVVAVGLIDHTAGARWISQQFHPMDAHMHAQSPVTGSVLPRWQNVFNQKRNSGFKVVS